MKRNKTAVLLIFIMIAAACLPACAAGRPAEQEDEKNASVPGGHVAYGFSYDVPETDWSYMFNADQLGTGDEWIDLVISGYNAGEGHQGGDEKINIDGRECYRYDGSTSKALFIPYADGTRLIEIRSDYIEDPAKADAFYEELLKGIKFTDDEGYAVSKDHVSVGGVHIPAQGLKPVQFFYGLMDQETTDGLVSMQIDFNDENYNQGVEKTFDDMGWDDDAELQGDGPFVIDDVTGKWYRWIDRLPDSLPYLSHVIMIPVDEMQTIMSMEYDFNADVEDISQYDGRIRELEDQIRHTKAE